MDRKFNSQRKLNIKKGDMVLVIAGDDKGKKGRVLEVMIADNRALVEGINIVSLTLSLMLKINRVELLRKKHL